MIKKMLPLAAVTALIFAGVTSGCTPEARQDVGEAGANVGQAVEKSAEGTAEAAQKAGTAVAEGADKAVDATVEAGKEATEAVGGAAKTVKEGVKEGVSEVGEAAGGAAVAVQKKAAALDLTPSVKAALVANDKIDASTINVDTKGDKKQVILRGSVKSAGEKKLAVQTAQAKLKEENSDYKVVDQLTVSK